ncbi:MAG TPA: manganese efflux pump MntP family protein [Slackia equolifaciens]|uniref:Putative manganese efflux pump MntP n=1 Tax=Slackia equolifaciens TaxID=498718 RepID=A0A9D2UVB5_9ACTN|nr:manganese efflux pump MntP family protein [Slackia equolifaciens]
MSIIEIVILGVALAMDAFAVTVSNVFCYRGASRARLLMLPVAFGIFQGLMPLLGFFLGGLVGNIIEQYAGIVTLVILGLIGGNMIKEGISDPREARAAREAGGDVCDLAPDAAALTLKVVLVQAVATSIDAFAVGVSLRAASVNIAEAAIIITLTTFLCCVVALAIGKRFGSMLGERAEIVGGVVLVIIGVKALFS